MMTKKHKHQLGVAALCVAGTILALQSELYAAAAGLALFAAAGLLLILSLRIRDD